MADTGIANFTAGATANASDRIAAIRSPFGAGDDRYLTPAYIKDYILGTANAWTAEQSFSGTAIAGLKLNNLTTTQQNALSSPAAGQTLFNTTLGAPTVYDGSVWQTALISSGANALRFGPADAAAPAAQSILVQNVVAGTSNTAGANTTFKASQGTGTGAGGSFIWQVAPAGSTGSAVNALVTALTIDSTKLVTFAGTAVTAAGSVSTTSYGFTGTQTGIFYTGNALGFAAAGTLVAYFDESSRYLTLTNASSGLRLLSNTAVIALGSSADVKLNWDASNVLALRNATSAQKFNIYSTFTDTSNYQRGIADAGARTANMFTIAADNLGTGVAMGLQFGVALTTGGGITSIANFNTSGHFLWNSDNTYDIGASGATRPRDLWLAGAMVPTKGGVTVAQLPTASTHQGGFAFVTDASTTAILGLGTAVTGGGANKVPVYSDGTNWIIL